MGPIAAGDHMVQKPPYWRGNCTQQHLKQSNLTGNLNFLCFRCPSAQFSLQYGLFLPRGRQLQRPYCIAVHGLATCQLKLNESKQLKNSITKVVCANKTERGTVMLNLLFFW